MFLQTKAVANYKQYNNKESSTESHSSTMRFNGSSLQLCQDLSQCWLDKIRKVSPCKSNPSQCSVSSTILCLCWARMVPKISGEEGKNTLCLFTTGFFRKFKSCLLHLVVFPSLIDTLAQFLAWSFFLCLWNRQRLLTLKYFHSIPLLTWTLALHLFYSVRRSLYNEREKNTHTHTTVPLFSNKTLKHIRNIDYYQVQKYIYSIIRKIFQTNLQYY